MKTYAVAVRWLDSTTLISDPVNFEQAQRLLARVRGQRSLRAALYEFQPIRDNGKKVVMADANTATGFGAYRLGGSGTFVQNVTLALPGPASPRRRDGYWGTENRFGQLVEREMQDAAEIDMAGGDRSNGGNFLGSDTHVSGIRRIEKLLDLLPSLVMKLHC